MKNNQMSESVLTACFLSMSGGLQDAYTYMFRGKVFANAATGNFVLLSQCIAEKDPKTAIHYIVPILFFASGIFISESIRLIFKDKNISIHWRQLVLGVEIPLLFAVGFIPRTSTANLIANAMVSLACSMQVQAFRKVNGYAYSSTMCIGNMRSGMDSFCHYVHSKNPEYLRKALHYFAIILLFGVGAALGGQILPFLKVKTIWLSCGLLFVSFLMMFAREEEELLKKYKGKIH